MGELSIPQGNCKCSDCCVLFFSETGKRRTCDGCKKQKNSKRIREWKRRRSIKQKLLNSGNPKIKALSVFSRSCAICKCMFVANGNRAMYCSNCNPIAKKKRIAEYNTKQKDKCRLRKAETIRACIVCGASYTPSQSRQKACLGCGKIHRRKTKTAYAKAWLHSKRKKHTRYRIEHSISSSVRRELKCRGKTKHQQAYLYVGLTGEKLMEYLLSHSANNHKRFNENNYGVIWHIDHVRPLASFSDNDVEFAWNYKNLQPIDGKENLRKGSLFMGMRWTR